jgi:sensor histidine kinase YesM
MRCMNINNLIFSDHLTYRIFRHTLFGGSIFIFSLTRIGIMYPPNIFWSSIPSYVAFAVEWTCVILGICYGIVYFLVPRLFYKKKYFLFACSVLFFLFIVLILNMFWINSQSKTYHGIAGLTFSNFAVLFPSAVLRILGSPLLVCCLLLSLKSLKNWQIKRKENEILSHANTHAELQLLKSQIHPHFLFNTLNNIYSYSLNNHKEAALLVNKFKNTVHYMIHECNQAYVPLKNELKMIANYIELEKIRYGNRLSMQVELMDNEKNFLIAPLLMIPFVENSFKHGVSQMLKYPWIILRIHVDGNSLKFYLSNSKPVHTTATNRRKGIGLNNVKKRLEILYPDKHSIEIGYDEESYTVSMEVQVTENFNPILQYVN